MWTMAHQVPHMQQGKILRIITAKASTLHWSSDDWATVNDLIMVDAGIGCWFGDVPTESLQAGARLVFTFLWSEGWEGKDFQVMIDPKAMTKVTT